MSIWSKPISEITFGDIDAFCKTMQPEGARLDYKGIAFPSDLAKTIAAFANTLGGIILLGIDADKITNKPVWPASAGMRIEAGLQERVYQIAHEAISPPVRVGVSNVIENPNLPGHVIVAIRINESREAPHATEKNRRVYVYERTSNKNEPYELAQVDRIEQLFKRRDVMVDARESELKANLERAARAMHKSKCPMRWISVSPVFPWREVGDPITCVEFHKRQHFPMRLWETAHWNVHNAIRGSFATGRATRDVSAPICVGVSSISSNGAFFGIAYTGESTNDNATLLTTDEDTSKSKPWVNLRPIREMASAFLESCQEFYKQSKNPPGEVLISIGLKNVFGSFMWDSSRGLKSNVPFMDPEYRIDHVLDAQNLLGARGESLNEVFSDIAFAFNAHAVSR